MVQKTHIWTLLILVILFTSCRNKKNERTTLQVRYSGALSNIMRGSIEETVVLDSLVDKDNLYALGAIENLRGEIQIFDGKATNSYVQDSMVRISSSFSKGAALLVYTQVEDWEEFTLSSSVKSKTELEIEIAALAKEYGIDSEKPFPFLIEGSISTLIWHVIDWKDGDIVHTHKKHQESGLNGIIENEAVEVLGFYSTKHKAVFTHHSTFMHLHFKTKDGSIAGHLDDLVLGEEMVLKLPKQ